MTFYPGILPPFDITKFDWLNSQMLHINGLWDGSAYAGNYADTFGAVGVACLPSITDGDTRHRPQWSITPLNGVSTHGCGILKTFGAAGVPAKPVGITSSYGLMPWAISGGVSPQLRLEYGIPILPLRQCYEAGFKTLTISGYLLALPWASGNIIDQNITTENHGDINAAGAGCKLTTVLTDSVGFVMHSAHDFMSYTPGAAWQPFSTTIVFDATDYALMTVNGADGLQLQIAIGGVGHPRICLLFNPCRIS